MAKGRKLTISRSERFLGSNGYAANEDDDVELAEDEVWSMADDTVNGGKSHHDRRTVSSDWSFRASVGGGATRSRHCSGGLPPASAGGLSVAFDDDDDSGKMMVPSQRIVHQFRNGSGNLASPHGHHVATSAPVNVPDWSKIYRVDSDESMHDSDDGIDDDDLDMVPPHEYLTRSHRSAAKSVFEGVGRTLKGRDMSRVRDAVWSQTRFDG
ncbi:hypothetical protein R6Q57_013554 [Mikania cordata]